MMDKYIKRDDLLQLVKINAPYLYSPIAPLVIMTPDADVAEVRHGEWVEFACDSIGKAFNCSLCGYVETTESFEASPLDNDCNYCSRCGAKMDGKDVDNGNL